MKNMEKGVKNMEKKYSETVEKRTVQMGSGSLAQIFEALPGSGSCCEKGVWKFSLKDTEDLIFGEDGGLDFALRFEELNVEGD